MWRRVVNHEAEIVIDAPVADVWSELLDFDRHSEWSDTFRLEGRPEVGASARVHFRLLGRRFSHPVVLQAVDEGRKLEWSGGPKGVFCGRHYFVLRPHGSDGGRTHLRHGEHFEGFAVPLLWPLLARAMGCEYRGFNEELKRRVESHRRST